jgi:hypothetical protein
MSIEAQLHNAQATIDELRAKLASTEARLKRLESYEDLFLCVRCGEIGHDLKMCVGRCSGKGKVDKNDVFMHSKIDRRIIHRLPTDMWRTALTYLPARDIIPHVPRACKYLNEVVWGEHAGKLLWQETNDIERVFRVACWDDAPTKHMLTLVSGGANVNATYDTFEFGVYGATPLMQACIGGHSNVVSTLIAAGASLDYVDRNGDTALIKACSYILPGCVRVLIDARADVTIRNNDGYSALCIAQGVEGAEDEDINQELMQELERQTIAPTYLRRPPRFEH